MKSVELFAGAGGLALGTHRAGFTPAAVIEWDKHACSTLRHNLTASATLGSAWPVHEIDARRFDFSDMGEEIDLVSGGPPCQPFSIGGKHRGQSDTRDMFPEAARAVRLLRPKAFIFENVRGLLRRSFARYFQYILLQLTYPELERQREEEWMSHLQRLEAHHTQGAYRGLYYRVVFRLVNAADYGVPQKRERVVIVGFRSDVREDWSFPEPTHSETSLLWSQWITRDYWQRHGVPTRKQPVIDAPTALKMTRIETDSRLPWRTVRDAISDLPTPEHESAREIPNHNLQPGARSYTGHTGSPFDEPAKTLKAGDHGVPGGENMVVLPDGKLRYFTVRESARLQTFPDSFVFTGSWTENMRQIGNAVPVQLAEKIARSVRAALDRKDTRVRERAPQGWKSKNRSIR
jgi:DNA (cytosine-5)-methyltransferase 1